MRLPGDGPPMLARRRWSDPSSCAEEIPPPGPRIAGLAGRRLGSRLHCRYDRPRCFIGRGNSSPVDKLDRHTRGIHRGDL